VWVLHNKSRIFLGVVLFAKQLPLESRVGSTTLSLDTPVSVSCNSEIVTDPSICDFRRNRVWRAPRHLPLARFLSKKAILCESLFMLEYITRIRANQKEGHICTVTCTVAPKWEFCFISRKIFWRGIFLFVKGGCVGLCLSGVGIGLLFYVLWMDSYVDALHACMHLRERWWMDQCARVLNLLLSPTHITLC
jgi:hypothetical protein